MPRRGRGQGHANAQHNLRLMRDKFVHSGVLFDLPQRAEHFAHADLPSCPERTKLAPELAPDNAERAGKRSDLGGLSLRRYSRKTGQNVTPSDGQGRRSHALPLHASRAPSRHQQSGDRSRPLGGRRESVLGVLALHDHRVLVSALFLAAHRLPRAHPGHAAADHPYRGDVRAVLRARARARALRLLARGA